LPRSFFHFIIDRGMTTRNDIFSTFWPNLDKKESTNIFHVTKRKVNELLDHDLTLYTGGFYRLSDTIQLHYDVVMFQEAMQMADISTQAAQAIPLYEKALSLYRGPFLNTIEMDWVKSRREELQQIYVDGMLNLADIYAQQGRTAQSLGLQQRAFALMPHREDIAHKLLTSALQNGQKGLGQEVFASLSTQLKRLGLSPSASILALMQQISAA
jgi:DNA-binding SARP family transcriptional activator